jgi:hypothetical protein
MTLPAAERAEIIVNDFNLGPAESHQTLAHRVLPRPTSKGLQPLCEARNLIVSYSGTTIFLESNAR